MQELKVENVIIGTQFENSENYEKFKNIIQKKKIKVNIVEADKTIKIEEKINIDILWPNSKNKINQNILNNNSLVFKFSYNKFSILFTGDIEEIAEKEILKSYKNNPNKLKSTVIKIAHHGSKTSSTQEFLNIVDAQIALIGVRRKQHLWAPK